MLRQHFCKVLLVVIAILGILVFSGILSAQGRSDDAFDRVKDVQERNTDWLMSIEGVVGTAIGLGQGAQPIVLVLLEYGGVPSIPEELEGVPVRPFVTGKIYALPKPPWAGGGGGNQVDPTSRFDRPVPIGVSTGHPDITAGTISCRVTDGTNVFALSNNHVYANSNNASIGDAVIQPGSYDGGSSPADDIGTLDDFEPIDFSGGNNTIDAAIAFSSTSLLGNATPSDGYGTPKSTTATLRINQKVKKYGRTTGLTKGQVYMLNASVNVNYGNAGVALFTGQIIITPGSFSAGGDSGSLIVVDDRKGKRSGPDDLKPAGLLFAGSNTVTIANPIDAVLSRFGVTVDGQ
ncbi:MAG: hypothetical protein FVQ85_00105 [Planctomycetes bacterium]|nr:hypothetical protein [Planctomycetota bacterium]